MNELLTSFHEAGVRYLLIGGQAMRLSGMPRFSMDWDFFIPPRDEENFRRLNTLLENELDTPIIPLGPMGENFIQTYLPRIPRFDEAEKSAVLRKNENGTPVKCLSGLHLLSAKQAANRPQDQTDIEFLLELQRIGKLK